MCLHVCALISSLLLRENFLAGPCLRTEGKSEPGCRGGILS